MPRSALKRWKVIHVCTQRWLHGRVLKLTCRLNSTLIKIPQVCLWNKLYLEDFYAGIKAKKKVKPCSENKMEGFTLWDTNVNTYPKTVMIKTVRNQQRDRQTTTRRGSSETDPRAAGATDGSWTWGRNGIASQCGRKGLFSELCWSTVLVTCFSKWKKNEINSLPHTIKKTYNEVRT